MKISLGKITKPIGLKGDVRIYSNSDFKSQRFKKGNKLIVEFNHQQQDMIVQSSSISGLFVKVKFEQINSIEEAECYRNAEVFIDSKDIHELKHDEFYFFDLKGCQVIDKGQPLGHVVDVMEYPAHVLLVVNVSDKKVYIPFIKEFVISVDVENKVIETQLIEGFV